MLQFDESSWLAKYIKFNTKKGKKQKMILKKISLNKWIMLFLENKNALYEIN